MKKLMSLLLLAFVVVAMASSAGATPVLTYGESQMYYTNREVVFRADPTATNGTYKQLDYSGATLPTLQVGDIFVGILNVQNLDNAVDGTYWSQDVVAPTYDQLTGIFAQEIKAINVLPAASGSFTLQVVLGVASASTFTTLNNDTFSTGLVGNEMIKMYIDTATKFEANGTIVQDIAVATDGTEWLTLGVANATDYAYTLITPQGTALDKFVGKGYLGLSVLDYIYPSTIFPALVDPEVGIPVQFYANSELEGSDPYQAGTSPWVFESNDPAYLNAVPEPATLLLLGTGILGIATVIRRKRA